MSVPKHVSSYSPEFHDHEPFTVSLYVVVGENAAYLHTGPISYLDESSLVLAVVDRYYMSAILMLGCG